MGDTICSTQNSVCSAFQSTAFLHDGICAGRGQRVCSTTLARTAAGHEVSRRGFAPRALAGSTLQSVGSSTVQGPNPPPSLSFTDLRSDERWGLRSCRGRRQPATVLAAEKLAEGTSWAALEDWASAKGMKWSSWKVGEVNGIRGILVL